MKRTREGDFLSGARDALAQVTMPNGWYARLDRDVGGGPYIQVRCDTDTCNVAGTPHAWGGRKWRLSYHMTRSEIVQTIFKAYVTAVEHEAREQFTYRGAAIFGPHSDVEALGGLCSGSGGGQDVRKEPGGVPMNPDLHDWLVERGYDPDEYDPDEYDPYGFGPVAAVERVYRLGVKDGKAAIRRAIMED